MFKILLALFLLPPLTGFAADALNSDNARAAARLAEFTPDTAPPPLFSIGRVDRAPDPDGKIAPGEWEDCAGFAAMRDFATGRMLPGGGTAVIRGGYDDRNFYFLILIPGARPDVPRRADDDMTIFSDGGVTELMFAAPGDALPRRIAVSAAGSMTDMTGLDRTFASDARYGVGTAADAKAPWLKNSGVAAPFYFIECAVPRQNLALPQDGFRFNVFHQGAQPSTLAPVKNSAAEVENFAEMRLLESGRNRFFWFGLGDPATGDFRLPGFLLGGGAQPPQAAVELMVFKRGTAFRENTGFDEVDGALETYEQKANGSWRRLKFRTENRACDWFELTYRIDGEIQTRLNGPLAVRPPLALQVRKFPSAGQIEIVPESDSGAPVKVEISDGAKTLCAETVPAAGTLKVDCRAWAPGQYRAVAEAGKDRVETAFTLPAPPAWRGNRLGLDEEVLPPFEPMTCTGRTVTVWNRRYQWNDSVIFTAADGRIAPQLVLIRSDRKESFRLEDFKVLKSSPTAVDLAVTGRADGVELQGTVRIEYDGLAWFEFDLAAADPLPIEGLALETELPETMATLFHGAPLRSLNGYIPDGTRQYPWQIYFWIGTPAGGLGFVNESREWFDTPETAAFATGKADGKVRFTVAFRGRETFTRGKLAFGLQLTPVKPLPRRSSDFVTENWGNRSRGQFPQLAKYMDFTTVWRLNCPYMAKICDPGGIDFAPLAAAVADSHARNVAAIPYFAPLSFTENAQPEFVDYYEEWIQTPANRWKSENTIQVRCCVASEYLDYLLWQLDRIQRNTHCDGFYFDGAFPVACANALHGCGYVDAEGKRQPTYAVRKIREFLRRSAMIARQNNRAENRTAESRFGSPPYQVWIHISGAVAPPMHSFATAMFAGEWFKQAIKAGANYDTLLTIEKFIPRYLSEPWGIPNYFLAIINKDSDPVRHTDTALAYIIPHGTGLYPRYLDPGQVRRVLEAKERFGTADARFYPPGTPPEGIRLEADPKQVAIGAWERPDGRILLALGNCSAQPQTVVCRGAAAGVEAVHGRAQCSASDDGAQRFELPPDSLQLLIIQRK